ncbi:hypothetical protein UFOVP650_50 [uncultured Caudovirales phage]|uniref:Uncharacterized protein n=1 Tax=uncultured Caudovirales phage TaxID=2100421 RepID=A0A6J5N5Y3_9CAUD|nr:hypothetical protein UFOVP650_50 [uncultured Caudovirales phage]
MADENEQTPPATDPVAAANLDDEQPPATQPAPVAQPPLESLTRAQLAVIVEERNLPGLAKANKAELIAAIREDNQVQLLKAQQEAATDGVEQPPPPDATGPILPPVLTDEQAQADERFHLERIRKASTSGLQAQLAKPDLPEHLRLTIRGELDLRARREFERERAERYSTQIERYVVTKGGRYVTRDGYITTIPEGSLLTRDTHDLAHVASQGIEAKPAQAVELSENQLGQQVSTVV